MEGSDFLITINEHSFKLNIVRWDEVTSQIFKAYSAYKLNNNITEKAPDEQKKITPSDTVCNAPCNILRSAHFDIIRTQLESEKNDNDQNADTSKKVETPPIEEKRKNNDKRINRYGLTILEYKNKKYNKYPICKEIVEYILKKQLSYYSVWEIAKTIAEFYKSKNIPITYVSCESYASQYRKYLIDKGHINDTIRQDTTEVPEKDKTEQPVIKKGCNEDKDEFQTWIEKTKPTTFTLQQFIDTYPHKLTEDQAINILSHQITTNTIFQLSNNTFKVKQTGEE